MKGVDRRGFLGNIAQGIAVWIAVTVLGNVKPQPKKKPPRDEDDALLRFLFDRAANER